MHRGQPQDIHLAKTKHLPSMSTIDLFNKTECHFKTWHLHFTEFYIQKTEVSQVAVDI